MKVTLTECLLVMVGSALGGLARYLLSAVIPSKAPGGGEFPWGIFMVNIAGCFLIGLLYSWLEMRPGLWVGWKPLLGTGFLGGFTTFSTLLWDTWRLGPQVGLLNLILSGAAGYGALALGIFLRRTGAYSGMQ